MTSPLTTQNPGMQGMQGMHQTQFPPSFGLEQQFGGSQQLVSQLLPIAYQVILPQVVATATQQIQQYIQYLIGSQLGGGSSGQQQQHWGGGFGGFGQNRPWGF